MKKNRYPMSLERELVRLYESHVDNLLDIHLDRIVREFGKELDDVTTELQALEKRAVEKSEASLERKVSTTANKIADAAHRAYEIDAKALSKEEREQTNSVDREDPVIDAEKLAWVAIGAGLIKDLGREVSNEVTDTTYEALAKKGTAPAAALLAYRAALKKKIDAIKAKTIFWAVDQATKLYNRTKRNIIKRTGCPGYNWMTMMDNRVRPTHARMHGRFFSWAEVSDIGLFPGEDDRCRCEASESWGSSIPQAPTHRNYMTTARRKRLLNEKVETRRRQIERTRGFKTVSPSEKKKRIKKLRRDKKQASEKLSKTNKKLKEIEKRLGS